MRKFGNIVAAALLAGTGLNGTAKGTIAGDAFNKALMRIWLGEQPVQSDLKRAMLGN